MSALIHPTAVIEPGARLGEGVEIGPYCTVGPLVTLGDGCRLQAHAHITGLTSLGPGCQVFPFASLGTIPQDLKYAGEETRLEIGARNTIREHVTMNPGTAGGGGVTRIGDDGLFMVGCHVAHDCRLGNNVILANNATLAGHVEVGDFAFIAGLSAVLQFVKIGAHAFVGGMTGVEQDVVPFGMVVGERGSLQGLNLVGLRRRGFSVDSIRTLQEAVSHLFDQRQNEPLATRAQALAAAHPDDTAVQDLVAFVRHTSRHGLCAPKPGHSLR